MIDLNMVLNLHRVLHQEPDATYQAAALMMFNITFALHRTAFNTDRAREILNAMHAKTLETLAEFERDEKGPYH